MSELTREEKQVLIRAALDARTRAVAPYSRFWVGAALRSADGRVFTGCNIENAAYSATICAERTAFCKAVSEGEREFVMIAIAGDCDPCPPCGVCRQALYEFCGPALNVIMAKSPDDFIERTLGELLPFAFGPANI